MIAKHIPMNSAKKSSFAGLIQYLCNAQSKQERVGQVRITNCQSDEAAIAMLEVINTQAQNTRSTADRTFHFVLGFPEGECPNAATLEEIELRFCAALGFSEHQRISVVHHDTDNLHVHIAINKIHPVRYTIHEPFNAYHIMGKLCERLEIELGLQQTNHRPEKTAGQNRADDMERHTAVESLLGWIKRECKSQMQAAPSWAALHQVLQGHGLRIHERANGLVITSDEGTSVKAGSVAREFSKAKLEQRLGDFEACASPPAEAKLAKGYDRQPICSRIDTTELYARYRTAQQSALSSRVLACSRALARKNRLIEDAKRAGRLKRAAIRLLGAPRAAKRLLYAATRTTLLADIAKINHGYLRERQAKHQQFPRLAWADWLRREAAAGDGEALAVLRARASRTRLKGNTMTGTGQAIRIDTSAKPDGVTKKGTVIYHLGTGAVRDDGDRLMVAQGSDRDALVAALQMAIARYGEPINVNGSAQFREQVLHAAVSANLPLKFDDDVLERRRRQLANLLKFDKHKHGIDNDESGLSIGRRSHRSSSGRSGRPAPGPKITPRGYQSYPLSARQVASTEADHGMRNLPERSVVHFSRRGEVLLPGDVSGHVERQGAQPDHSLRRHLRGAGRLKAESRVDRFGKAGKTRLAAVGSAPPPPGRDRLRPLSQLGAIAIDSSDVDVSVHRAQPPMPQQSANADRGQIFSSSPKSAADAAVEKYVIEREQKRRIGFDIPKHRRFTFTGNATVTYAGTRVVDGLALALLDCGDEIMVLAVDEATSRRLRRLPLGRALDVGADGVIKSKGRSR